MKRSRKTQLRKIFRQTLKSLFEDENNYEMDLDNLKYLSVMSIIMSEMAKKFKERPPSLTLEFNTMCKEFSEPLAALNMRELLILLNNYSTMQIIKMDSQSDNDKST